MHNLHDCRYDFLSVKTKYGGVFQEERLEAILYTNAENFWEHCLKYSIQKLRRANGEQTSIIGVQSFYGSFAAARFSSRGYYQLCREEIKHNASISSPKNQTQ